MKKCIRIHKFAKEIFTDEKTARIASQIMEGIMTMRSPRLSDIAACMPGGYAASYKRIQRFSARTDTKGALERLFQSKASFVIGDPTEIPRPEAERTPYVGTLADGQTRGFWMLVLATPLPWPGNPLWLRDLLVPDDCRGKQLP